MLGPRASWFDDMAPLLAACVDTSESKHVVVGQDAVR
jgi:hypothetical protein